MIVSLAAALTLVGELAKLGASPAIQQLIMAFLSEQMGVDQKVLDAAVEAQRDAPPPRKA